MVSKNKKIAMGVTATALLAAILVYNNIIVETGAPPSEIQPATGFVGWFIWGNSTSTGNFTKQMLWNGSNGGASSSLTSTSEYIGPSPTSSLRWIEADYSRVSDIAVGCINYRNGMLYDYSYDTKNGIVLSKAQIDSNVYAYSYPICEVINIPNSSMFAVLYDEADSDDNLRFILYNGTGFETSVAIPYDQPAVGGGNIRGYELHARKSNRSEITIMANNNGGSDSFQIVVYNFDTNQVIFNWSTGSDIVHGEVGTNVGDVSGSSYDSTETMFGLIYTDKVSDTNFMSTLTVYNRTKNEIVGTYQWNNSIGFIESAMMCPMKNQPHKVAAIVQTNLSYVCPYILDLTTGEETGLGCDTTTERNTGAMDINIGCYPDEAGDKVFFWYVDSTGQAVSYFMLNTTDLLWYNSTSQITNLGTQRSATGTISGSPLSSVIGIPCPLGDCMMLLMLDDAADFYTNVFYNGTAVGGTYRELETSVPSNNPVFFSLMFKQYNNNPPGVTINNFGGTPPYDTDDQLVPSVSVSDNDIGQPEYNTSWWENATLVLDFNTEEIKDLSEYEQSFVNMGDSDALESYWNTSARSPDGSPVWSMHQTGSYLNGTGTWGTTLHNYTNRSFTVCTWYYSDDDANTNHALVQILVNTTATLQFFLTNGWGNDFNFQFYNVSGQTSDTACNPTGSLIANSWYHLCGVYNVTSSKKELYAYVNGTRGCTQDVTEHTPRLGTKYGIIVGGDNLPVNGSMDGVIIIPRALPDNQIQNMYNATARGYPTRLDAAATETADNLRFTFCASDTYNYTCVNQTQFINGTISLNASLNTGITSVYYKPATLTSTVVLPTGETSTIPLFNITNNGTIYTNVCISRNSTYDKVDDFCATDYFTTNVVNLTPVPQLFYSDLQVGQRIAVWCARNYSNPSTKVKVSYNFSTC